jgi:hypothetical protein
VPASETLSALPVIASSCRFRISTRCAADILVTADLRDTCVSKRCPSPKLDGELRRPVAIDRVEAERFA